MALLHILKEKNVELVVAHVNYKQRNESDEEEKMVKDYCHKNSLSFYSIHYKDTPAGNFQANARKFRYEFFQRLIKEHKLAGVMVGHHYNDHLETYLMQKERGHQTETLGMAEETIIFDILVKRPLLHLTKEQLISYCVENDVPYRMDASNMSPQYTRNRIRLNGFDMKKTQKQFKIDQLFFNIHQYYLEQLMQQYSQHVIALDQYEQIESELRLDFLRFKLASYNVQVHHLKRKFFVELDRQILQGRHVHEFPEINIYSDQGNISFYKPKTFEYTFNDISEFKCKEFMFSRTGAVNQGLHLQSSDFPITVRNVRPGDKIRMRYGVKKVSRYLIDRKIPRFKRETWLVLENAMKECIFVMGMGCDVAHYANNPNTFVIELNLL